MSDELRPAPADDAELTESQKGQLAAEVILLMQELLENGYTRVDLDGLVEGAME